jgi:hypothetical protein
MAISSEKSEITFFGIIGLLASLLVGAGEFLVHYSATGYEVAADFVWLKQSDHSIVIIGHYLMLIGLPLYIFGYYHFYLTIRQGSEGLARAILVLGIIAFTIGGVWAGSRALLTEIVKSENIELINYYKAHYEILVNVLRFIILLISIAWLMAIWFRNTRYPKWLAWFSPVVILVLVFLTYFLMPSLGKYLVPTAMNVTHFVVFSLSLITQIQYKK